MQEARRYQDNLLKPIGSLGALEDISIRMAGITGHLHTKISKKAIGIFCADNGVWEEGISTAPQSVTAVQAVNFLRGVTGIGVLAAQNNITLKVVDVGMKEAVQYPGLLIKKAGNGTKNCLKEPAMTSEQVFLCMETGFQLAQELKREGYDIAGTGEMGVGNTTTAACVIIGLTGARVEDTVGKGAGLTETQFQHKKEIVSRITAKYQEVGKNPIEVIKNMGGFDIAALMGMFLGAAYFRLPIIIDGVISIAAALAACRFAPLCREYLFASHCSEEKGYQIAAKQLGLTPYFQLGMRLGEGTGCPFTMYLMEMAAALTNQMTTFQDSPILKQDFVDIREENNDSSDRRQ